MSACTALRRTPGTLSQSAGRWARRQLNGHLTDRHALSALLILYCPPSLHGPMLRKCGRQFNLINDVDPAIPDLRSGNTAFESMSFLRIWTVFAAGAALGRGNMTRNADVGRETSGHVAKARSSGN